MSFIISFLPTFPIKGEFVEGKGVMIVYPAVYSNCIAFG